MAAKLPIKLQIAIRDYWDKDTAAVQVARAALQSVLGFPVLVNPEWPQLFGALDSVYPDRQALATAVAGCVEIWCKVCARLLDGADAADADQQTWAEDVVDCLARSGRTLRLEVDVVGQQPQPTAPGTLWCDERAAFRLYLPNKTPVLVPSDYAPLYESGLLCCFKSKDKPAAGSGGGGGGGGGEDWADVEMDKATGTAKVVDAPAAPVAPGAAAGTQYLPSVDSLPRPDELFLRPPYHIIVSDYGQQKVVVQGSHGPSLQLLGEYLKRWCRINYKDSRSPPAVAVKYNQSCWGSGVMYDQLTLTADNNIYTFNPAIVLAFVEGVLGYGQVSTSPGIWLFKRTTAFKA